MRKDAFSFAESFWIRKMDLLLLVVLLSAYLMGCSPGSVVPTQVGGTAIRWQRSGGLAGICQRLTVGQDASYQLLDCSDESLIKAGTLSPEQWDSLNSILERYGETQFSIVPAEGTADMFTDEVSIFGTGSGTPSPAEQTELVEQLAQLAADLALPEG
jgi:hypothetical protein